MTERDADKMFRIRCAIRPAGALSGWQIHAAQQEIQFGQIGVVQLGAGAAQGRAWGVAMATGLAQPGTRPEQPPCPQRLWECVPCLGRS